MTPPPEPTVIINGFRMRGEQMTRIEVFTDAAFAFAVTLLVVSIDSIPNSYNELMAALPGIPAFAISFTILFMFWHAHYKWSQRYGLDDGTTIALSATLVFLVMVYVYPLKMMSNGVVSFFTRGNGDYSTAALQLDGPEQLRGLFIIYGVGFVAMSATILLAYVHALRLRDQLDLDAIEIHVTSSEIRASLAMIVVGIISIALAAFLPTTLLMFGIPGWAYMLLAVVMPILGIRSDRHQQRMLRQQQSHGSD